MAPHLDLVVHSTHEAGVKLGGIGAVLDGLLAQQSYNKSVERTILVGPFNSSDGLEMERLTSPRNKFRVLYFSYGIQFQIPSELLARFRQVERDFNTPILYGKRRFGDYEHEVLLVDPHLVNGQSVREFKFYVWEKFGVDSSRYENDGEYNWFMAAAAPGMAALDALVNGESGKAMMIAHEWLGLPLAFAAMSSRPDAYLTTFYAHEVATIRPLIEGDRGHDTRFYNAMRAAQERNLYVSDVFGDQTGNFRHALLAAAVGFDEFFAVSDLIEEELKFLSPAFAERPISLVYNGVPDTDVTLDARWISKERLRHYAHTLLGFEPSWVFTHVTRMVPSKGLWRDIRVLEQLDDLLVERGETALLFTLSSQVPQGRSPEDVRNWELEYGWPVYHRSDNGDLVGMEVEYWQTIEQFNHTARAARIVLVNQFGWSRDSCGVRMPADMEYADIRRGSDLEFGQSIYEPFGIAQLEPLCAGALCCLSTACGCVGFIRRAGGIDLPNIVVADYITLPVDLGARDVFQMLNIGQVERDIVENIEARRVAQMIIERLPRNEAEAIELLENGQALCQKMSWDVVVESELLPALEKLSLGAALSTANSLNN